MTQTPLFRAPLLTNLTPSVGTGTPAFTRNFNADCLLTAPDTFTDAAHLVPLFGLYGANFSAGIQSLFNDTGTAAVNNRDLTQSGWVKTNCTALKNVTGLLLDANAASRLTATGANATCLLTLVNSAAARTSSSFIKRISGTGTISITVDGTTWVDVTAQISSGQWSRVKLAATGANLVLGYKLGSSGDVIAVDCCQVVDQVYASSPLISFPYNRSTNALVYTSVSMGSPSTQKRYYMQATLRFDEATGPRDLVLQISKADESQAVYLNLSDAGGGDVVLVGSTFTSGLQYGINRSTSAALGKALATLSPDTDYLIGIEVGWGQAVLTINGVRYSADFDAKLADPDFTQWSRFAIPSGGGWLKNAEAGERLANEIVMAGDSMTEDPRFTLTLRALTDIDYVWQNRGVAGNKIADIAARRATDIDPYSFTDAVTNDLFLRVGSNDLAVNTSAAIALAALQSLINAIRAAATWSRIFLINMLHRSAGFTGTNTANFNAQRVLFNAGLAALTGHNGIVDVAGIPQAADSTNVTYYGDGVTGDGIHPGQALIDLICPLIIAKQESNTSVQPYFRNLWH